MKRTLWCGTDILVRESHIFSALFLSSFLDPSNASGRASHSSWVKSFHGIICSSSQNDTSWICSFQERIQVCGCGHSWEHLPKRTGREVKLEELGDELGRQFTLKSQGLSVRGKIQRTPFQTHPLPRHTFSESSYERNGTLGPGPWGGQSQQDR